MNVAAQTHLMRRSRHRARFLRFRTTQVGIAIIAVILAIAIVGPVFAPYSPGEITGIPYSAPGEAGVLGTDFIGRDLLSRLLWGGRNIVALSVLATVLAYVIGITIGLVAGYTRSMLDPILMRSVDVLLAFPPLIFLLVLATGAGQSIAVLVIGVAVVQSPGIARVIRSATLEASVRGYVEAAVARGEHPFAIMRRDILPNISGTILADVGVRLTYSILLIASVNFLGLGLQPPAADWSLMIAENRGAISLQPWATVIPAILIAALTIGVNLIADGVARSLGTSIEERRSA
jgi:ABC-type dipeptide/oligopeptide/nickel transport system permease subunit